MRIDALDIRRYGPLLPRRLDLSAGREGVHVIYGGNEWGKSLSLQALEHALFAIPKSFDGFSNADLAQVELSLTLRRSVPEGTSRLAFVRRRNSVVSAESGDPIEERQIQSSLGGITAETFRQMYGLSAERIREGGRLLQNSKGDIAATLFAAATGLERVRDVGQSIDARLKGLYSTRANAPKYRLNNALQAMRAGFVAYSAAMQSPEAVKRLEGQLEGAVDDLEGVERKIRRLHERASHIGRLRAVRPAAGRLHAARQRIESLGSPPLLAETFRTRLDTARPAITLASRNLGQLATAVGDLRGLRDGIVVDERVVDAADAIGDLLGSTAELQGIDTSLVSRSEDIDRRTKANSEFLRDIAATTGRTLRETASQSAGTLARIDTLIQEHGGIAAKCDERGGQLNQARRKLENLEGELARAGVVADDADLVRRVTDIRDAGDLESQFAATRERVFAAAGVHEASCRRLDRLPADVPVESLRVPSRDEVRECRDQFRSLEQERSELDRETDTINKEIAGLESRIVLLEQGVDLPGEGELGQARAERDSLLAAMADALAPGGQPGDVPRRLEEISRLVERADAIADRLFSHADGVSQRRQHTITIEGHCKQAAQVEIRRQRLAARRTDVEGGWKRLWEPAGIDPGSPVAMEAWLAAHAECRQQADELRESRLALESLGRRIEADRAALREILLGLGDDPAVEATRRQLLEGASRALESRRERAIERKQIEDQLLEARREVPRLETLLDEATKQRDAWNSRWAECMEVLDQPRDVSVDSGRYLLDTMRKVAANEAAIGDLQVRITDMQDRRAEIHEIMRQVSTVLDVPFDPAGIRHLGREASDRLRENQKAQTRRQSLDDEIARTEKEIAAVRRELEANEAVMATLRKEARVDADDALDEAWDRSQQLRQARQFLDEAEEAFFREAGHADPRALLEECLRTTVEEIEQEIGELEREAEALRSQRDEARDRRKVLQEQVDRLGNARAARAAADLSLHESTVLERVREYIPLRMAALALARASRRYRDEHHAPVLRRASDLFQRITCGRYAEIRLAENDLYAVRAGAGAESVLQRHMSEGTRDQIYLALRLAALEHSHAQGAEPLPLVLDDGLVHFDDGRTAAMLEVLADVSARMQVIVFTHHASVVSAVRSLQSAKPETFFLCCDAD